MTKRLTIALSLVFSLFFNFSIQAQFKCGTQISANNREAQQRFMPGYFGCEYINQFDKTLQITVHICRDSVGNTNYNENFLAGEIEQLNIIWDKIGIAFKVCDIRYMDNFQFDEFIQSEHLDNMLAMYYQQNTINMYLVNSVETDALGIVAGFAALPGGRDFIIINKTSADNSENGVIPHEMGHFFGLYHTFETEFGDELVNGSNCETTGDLVCDTEANPSDLPGDFIGPTCRYIGMPAQDSNNEFYVPPGNNFMSYSDCGCRFTPQQYNRMLEQYLQLRAYLW